jgi:hypothetical protein
MSGMPRPQISEDLKTHLEQVVEKRADVPAKHLTFEQKVIFVLNQLKEESQESDSGGLFS